MSGMPNLIIAVQLAPTARNVPGRAIKRGKSRFPSPLNIANIPSLADGRPDLLTEWDEERKDFLAGKVSCGSNKKVWWVC
jgi:hypothetical protein